MTTAPPAADAPGDRRVVLAAIAGAHGVGGDVRLKLFTDDLGGFADVLVGDRPMTIVALRSGGTVARLAGLSDRNAAEALRGALVSVARSALPPLGPGEYYHADLIGLRAETDGGRAIGTVVAVDNFGAGDVIEIETAEARRFMVPMTSDAVPEWDDARLIVASAFVTD